MEKIVAKACNGRDNSRAVTSDLRIASDFGINSPMMTCSAVKEMIAMTNEIALTKPTPRMLTCSSAGNIR